MRKVTVSGKTVEEAIELGVSKLSTTHDNIEYTILEEAQKAFLGIIGGKPAIVEVREKPDPVNKAIVFLRDTIDKMGISASVEKEDREDGLYLNITGVDIGILIGKRGQTLDSLQYLVNLVANRYSDNYIRIYLDAEGYRERRKEALENLAMRLSNKALRTGKEVRLEPMNAHERKIIHTALQNTKGIKTYSSGEDPNRRIIVAPK